jgi:hypothetical protein
VFVALGALGVCGIVVTVTELDAADAGPSPTEFVPVTVIFVTTPEPKPWIVIGEDEPVAECVTPCTEQYPDAVKDVAGAPSVLAVKVTVTAPLLYGRLVPTFVAVPIVGASGARKSFAD